MDVLKNAVQLARKFLKSNINVGSVLKTYSFMSDIFSSQPTNQDIYDKLIVISSQLEQISRDIRSLEEVIICQNLEKLFEQIHVRLFALELKFKNYCRKLVSKDDLRNLYNDNGQGINFIISRFLIILDEKMETFVLKCAKCKSSRIDRFRQLIRSFYVSIVINIKIHHLLNVRIYPEKPDFDYEKFELYFNRTWSYFDQFLLPNLFNVYDGRKEEFIRIVKEKKSAARVKRELESTYDYFNWDVIIYPKTHGFDKHCFIEDPSQHFSSGVDFFLREFDDGKCGLIAWYLPDAVDNGTIRTGNFSDHAQQNSERIWELNNRLIYVLTVHTTGYRDIDISCPDNSGEFKKSHNHYDVTNKGVNYGQFGGRPSEKYYHKVCSFAAKRSSLENHPVKKPHIQPFGV